MVYLKIYSRDAPFWSEALDIIIAIIAERRDYRGEERREGMVDLELPDCRNIV